VIALSAGSWYVVNAPRRNLLTRQAQVSLVRLQHPVEEVNPSVSNTETLLDTLPTQKRLKQLQPIVADGSIKLRKTAAIKFQEMVAARAAGVVLGPISGFRSAKSQDHCF